MSAAITGVGVALPGVTAPEGLLAPPVPGAARVDPAALIGKKGLRYKDRATQLGLCLSVSALTDAGLLDATGRPTAPGERVGVVVSTNLGNADTVCRAVETIAKEGTRGLSPMDTPNASSNITASEIAIRFDLRGPNLTVCNGVTSGLDAVRWAALTVRSGRADHMLVVGVEPDNEVTRALMGGPVVDGGAGLVVSRAAGSRAHALIGPQVRTAGLAACAEGLAAAAPGGGVWLTDDPAPVPPGAARLDLRGWGEASGALGVLQCAAASAWLAQDGTEPAYALLGGADVPSAGLVLLPGGHS
ncbi:beta-ketoacyl synthase N-terminal-like domain-containing protein [Streptomyces sp. PTY087I2]|uniref:beta-ketoacyl synthase N-terminal-like domain-containing protein n=1 Tax=Streptomyces sp. PTY087I2 TaxID=1819298 RepID=UPI00080B2B23|nr:beta-ketoacyl synthase N-terminal-like domain-containing protein [Streptomyces sp. PTY087I2]OCC07762.1 3-oxoacyl-[acyl-carrier-protein] synthase 2 [Streptomyces sp. PTY087I2]